MQWNWIKYSLIIMIALSCCKEKTPPEEGFTPDPNYDYGNYDATTYKLNVPDYVPFDNISSDNPMTQKGVQLGRKLFYDPILSGDSNITCATCHAQEKAFGTEATTLKNEYKGIVLERNVLALFNQAWYQHFGWDNRKNSLEEKTKGSIENPFGMQGDWTTILDRLNNHDLYPRYFHEVFDGYEITEDKVKKAVAQFMYSIISYDSKFDQFLQGKVNLSQEELLGFQIFSTEKGDCFHCHSHEAGLFFLSAAQNNGLDSVESLQGFDDNGYGNVTNNEFDNGKFKSVSLRNLSFTAPYMHDGRFETLREVLEHYNSGGKYSPTVSPTMKYIDLGLNLTEEDIDHLEAFLMTLNDSSLVTDTSYSNPFN